MFAISKAPDVNQLVQGIVILPSLKFPTNSMGGRYVRRRKMGIAGEKRRERKKGEREKGERKRERERERERNIR